MERGELGGVRDADGVERGGHARGQLRLLLRPHARIAHVELREVAVLVPQRLAEQRNSGERVALRVLRARSQPKQGGAAQAEGAHPVAGRDEEPAHHAQHLRGVPPPRRRPGAQRRAS